MRELLYVPAMDPPEQVLHHAILYRDYISTLLPDHSYSRLSDRTKQAQDAGLFRPRVVTETWNDSTALWSCIGAIVNRAIAEGKLGEGSDVGGAPMPTAPVSERTYQAPSAEDPRCILFADALNQQRDKMGISKGLIDPELTITGTAIHIAQQARRDADAPLILPCYPLPPQGRYMTAHRLNQWTIS